MAAAEKEVFRNGTSWLRADFHLHTRSDDSFDYSGAEKDFIQLYIEKLKEQEIGVGVITNHNKFDREEFALLRKAARKEGIGLFAGVELAVDDGKNGIHCLIIFDYERWCVREDDYINQFLTAAFEGIANSAQENTKCKMGFEAILRKLADHADRGRDSFIIPAHVEDKSGFFEEMKGGRIQPLVANDLFRRFVLGFQKVRTRDKVNIWTQWFEGKLPAFVEGSDCKNIDEVGRPHSQNGKEKKTYIKIGDFNYDALKYALVDHPYRVASGMKPEIKNAFIQSLSFEGGLLDKTKINFSPELNCIIGIRGSGKSSILEILRYTLGIPLTATSVDEKYKNDLIKVVLGSGGKVTTHIVNERKEEYRIEKIYDQKEDVYKNDVLQSNISLETVLDTPVYFGQKDLSNKDADFEADLVRRLVGDRMKDIHHQIEKKKLEVKATLSALHRLRDLEELKNETEKVLHNVSHQLDYYKKQGIEQKLKEQTLFDADIDELEHNKKGIQEYLMDLKELIADHDHFFNQDIEGSEQNFDLFKEVDRLFGELKSEFEKLQKVHTKSSDIFVRLNGVLEKIKDRRGGLKEEFAKIKREINAENLNPDLFLKLNREHTIAQLKLKEIDKSENKRIELRKQLDHKLVNLDDLWHKEYKILCREVERINKAETRLDIKVEYKGRKDKFLEVVKQTFRGTGIRETAYQEIIEYYRDFIQMHKNSKKLQSILNESQRANFSTKFKENIENLLTYQVENTILIKYNGKPLDKHSLGQRASALILFLLAQRENNILIIDQPEDDLDNQTIYDEVIKEIKKLKGEMQFIFATHNANIPVLGDSEKVIVCSSDDVTITVESGNIDQRNIQRKIVNIMEGGQEAFDRRKNIYRIWNMKK